MLEALRNGKLGSHYTLAHDRAEDLLTSTVFQLLRYIPISEGLTPILRRAHPVNCKWRIFDADSFEVELWPRLGRCQPDVVVTLKQQNRVVQRILIEAKLFSGMSNRPEESELDEQSDIDDTSDQIRRNQLSLYWESFDRQCRADHLEHAIIYLTGHLTPPEKELETSFRSGMCLAWLSWYDVHAIAASVSGSPAKDLAEILSQMGFATFSGFRTKSTDEGIAMSGHFLEWFSKISSQWKSTGRFWSRP